MRFFINASVFQKNNPAPRARRRLRRRQKIMREAIIPDVVSRLSPDAARKAVPVLRPASFS